MEIIKNIQRIWFTSDIHFGHNKAYHYMPAFRDPDTDKMDQMVIDMWNDAVHPRDIVYNLGDLTFYRELDELANRLDKLNGIHHLILGNHDHLAKKHKDYLATTKKNDGHRLLEEIVEYKEIKLRYEGGKITTILSHYPFYEWKNCQRGSYMLHGHLHDYIAPLKGKILNVCYDLHGKMISEEEVHDFLKDIPSKGHHDVTKDE